MEQKKSDLRRMQQAVNRQVPPEEMERAGLRIREKLLTHAAFQQADSIFCYVSSGFEIPTIPILQTILDLGKELSVPKCRPGGQMEARIIHDLNELHPGWMNLWEPSEDAVIQPCPDLCLMPCVACTKDGVRLGHGGGYYDRYLSERPQMKTIILCGSWQVRDSLPFHAWDMHADAVVTENDQ